MLPSEAPLRGAASEATTLPRVVTNLSLHRGKPGGGEWGGTRAVVANLSLHRGKPGGGEWCTAGVVVANLLLHRGKPGGGERWGGTFKGREVGFVGARR